MCIRDRNQTSDSSFLNQQITETIARIKTTTDEITQRQQELSGMTSAIDIAQTQDELTAVSYTHLTLPTSDLV